MITNPAAATHGHDEEQQEHEPEDERQSGEPDSARDVRVEVGASNLLDELRVFFGKPALDLVEDPLFVIV